MISNDMFIIESPYGKKEMDNTITKTSEIFNKLPTTISISENEDKLSLYFNSIYIKKNDKHPLLEIGYSPKERIELKIIKEKTVFFSIQNIHNIFSYKIYSDHTCFDAEFHFANLFFTVPGNIIVSYNGKQLDDDCYLFDLDNGENSPFFISFKDGYQLFYTFFEKFSYVCMKSDSTLQNLKETLIKKGNIFGNVSYGDYIKNYSGFKEKVDEKAVLSEIKILVFDFNFLAPSNKMKKIKFDIEADKKLISHNLELPENLTIYYLTIYLEEIYKIDRSFFNAYDSQNRILKLDTKIKEATNGIKFKLTKKLYVVINNVAKQLSPVATIKDIQSDNNFAKSNFGIIINKHFVSSLSNHPLLTYYLNGDKNTEIIFKKPIEPCHIFTFKEKEIDKDKEKNKEKEKTLQFIVPDDMKNDVGRIINLYMNKNINSINVIKANDWICEYNDFSGKKDVTMKIDFDLVDNNGKHNHTVDVKVKNPRVIDFLSAIKNNLKWYFQTKKKTVKKINGTLDAYLSGRKLLFSEPLSQILYNKENKITVMKSENENEKFEIDIFCMVTNTKITLDIENKTTHEIIESACKHLHFLNSSNYSLYMEYNELQPNDYPYICTHEKEDFLILNLKSEKKSLFITNGKPLRFNFNLDKSSYLFITDYNRAIFQIDNLVFFYDKYQLPNIFNAGCFSDESEIRVKYDYHKTNRLTFYSEGKKFKLEISNIDLKIRELKSEIIKKIEKFDVPESSLIFTFHGQQLDVNKSFPEYEISEDTLIYICRVRQCFELKLSVPEKFQIVVYVSETNTVQEIKNLIKIKYNYNENFKIKSNSKSNLSNNEKFKKDIKYSVICNKIKIKSQGSIGKEVFEISELLTVKLAKLYIRKKFFENKKYISIFVRNDTTNSFEKVDENKRLFEIKDKEIFVHKLFNLDSIKFENKQFNMNIKSEISECNTVEWFKNKILSKIILNDKKIMLLSENNYELKDDEKIGESVKNTTNIAFVKENMHARRKSYRKSINGLISSLSKPNDEVNTIQKSPTCSNPQLPELIDEEKRANNKNSNANKSTQNHKHNSKEDNENDSKKRKGKKKSDDDDDNEINKNKTTGKNSNNQSKNTKSDNDNDTKSDNDNDTKSGNDNDTKSENDDSCIEEEEDVENSDSDVDIFDEDADDGPKYKYNFQIGSDPMFNLKFKKDATINDAKIKIAKIQDDIDPSCVSILFAGKNLKKTTNIKSLKLTKNDVLQVYIQNIEEIFLRTAKALRFSGRNIDINDESSDSEEEDLDGI